MCVLLEDEEVQALLENFADVWKRVSPSPEAETAAVQAESDPPAAVRAARWVPEL